MITPIIDRIGEFNPQLFRELKGRLKGRNILIATAISLCGQFLLYLYYEGLLPSNYDRYSRYCQGNNSNYSRNYQCLHDAVGNIIINWQLWWLDLFTCMSIVGIFVLLVIGTYMLISDIAKEESQGTLNFIRFSPQAAHHIFTGKMLGVPILLYLVGLLAIPLHIYAGLAAHIPFKLILAFYLVLFASCVLFYTAALFYSLVSFNKVVGFKALIFSGALFFFLCVMTSITLNEMASRTTIDWLLLFYPGTVLAYLSDATNLGTKYLQLSELTRGSWYQLNIWNNAVSGIGFILLNHCVWVYWLRQGLKRRFHNPTATPITKPQSYWLTGIFVLTMLGFAFQQTSWRNQDEAYYGNLAIFLFFNLIFFLGLIASLSPHRQTLSDWARYRHQVSKQQRNLVRDLLFGDKSPATVAIGLNLAITTSIILVAVLVMPLEEYQLPALLGVVLHMGIVCVYASIVQVMLFLKTTKRGLWAVGSIAVLTIVPLICFAILRVNPMTSPGIWLFTFLPIVATKEAAFATVGWAIAGQWLAVTLTHFQLQRQLKQVGDSETKLLLN